VDGDNLFNSRTFVIVNDEEYKRLFFDMSITATRVQQIALEKGYIIPKEQVGEA
jgi:hypothetical protein